MNTVDFTRLYDCLTKNNEISFPQTFLLYMLIQGNNNFAMYTFARSDCDTLVKKKNVLAHCELLPFFNDCACIARSYPSPSLRYH